MELMINTKRVAFITLLVYIVYTGGGSCNRPPTELEIAIEECRRSQFGYAAFPYCAEAK